MMKRLDRLLIVDADKSVRDYFATIGQTANFEVAKAIDASEMKRKLIRFSPSVVLLGLHGDVTDAVAKLKLLNDLKCIAKIVFLGDMNWRNLQTATHLGKILGLNISGAIQKPMSTDNIRENLTMLRITTAKTE